MFSALRDFFKKKIPTKGSPLHFWSFATECMLKIPKGPSFQFFRHCEIFFQSSPNSPKLGNFEVLLLFLSLGHGADLGRSRLVRTWNPSCSYVFCRFSGRLFVFSLFVAVFSSSRATFGDFRCYFVCHSGNRGSLWNNVTFSWYRFYMLVKRWSLESQEDARCY